MLKMDAVGPSEMGLTYQHPTGLQCLNPEKHNMHSLLMSPDFFVQFEYDVSLSLLIRSQSERVNYVEQCSFPLIHQMQ
jgi:hypothetical protein